MVVEFSFQDKIYLQCSWAFLNKNKNYHQYSHLFYIWKSLSQEKLIFSLCPTKLVILLEYLPLLCSLLFFPLFLMFTIKAQPGTSDYKPWTKSKEAWNLYGKRILMNRKLGTWSSILNTLMWAEASCGSSRRRAEASIINWFSNSNDSQRFPYLRNLDIYRNAMCLTIEEDSWFGLLSSS